MELKLLTKASSAEFMGEIHLNQEKVHWDATQNEESCQGALKRLFGKRRDQQVKRTDGHDYWNYDPHLNTTSKESYD